MLQGNSDLPEWDTQRLAQLFPSPALPGSGSKGIISVPQRNTPKARSKIEKHYGIEKNDEIINSINEKKRRNGKKSNS